MVYDSYCCILSEYLTPTEVEYIHGYAQNLPLQEGRLGFDGKDGDSIKAREGKSGNSDSTIRKNIAFGIADDLIDEKKIDKSVKSSKVVEFLDNLQIMSDYALNMKCGDVGIEATMFLTELPYLANRKPIYQVNIDIYNILNLECMF